jgi:hypothetical protein
MASITLPVRIFCRLHRDSRCRLLLGQNIRQRQFDTFMAGRAAAARFGVVDHLFKGGQAVGQHRAANLAFVDAKAFADKFAFFMIVIELSPR